MAAPVIAPIAPPTNAPEAVLFCVPSGFWHPVNPTAEAAKAKFKVKICSFIIKNPFHQTTNGIPTFKINRSGPVVRLFPPSLLFPKTVSAANRFQFAKEILGAGKRAGEFAA
jgi:hypothetical protein